MGVISQQEGPPDSGRGRTRLHPAPIGQREGGAKGTGLIQRSQKASNVTRQEESPAEPCPGFVQAGHPVFMALSCHLQAHP